MIKLHKTLLILFLFSLSLHGSKIAIIGCGHLGLTMAAVFAQERHHVLCVDVDTEKVTQLKREILPMYEPQLKNLLFHSSKNVKFFNNLLEATQAELFYICVDTPIDAEGNCDCSAVYAAFKDIVSHCSETKSLKVICVKSTVKPGTMRELQNFLMQEKRSNIGLVYNPEFMREGSALADIYENNPIVLASDSLEAMQKIEDSYANSNSTIIKTNFETAELIKYAWNSFSAMRIAYVNELAMMCRSMDADISTVVRGIALSERLLPTESIKPGPGYGGSCLPKETLSFAKVMEQRGISCSIIRQVIASNKQHQERVVTDVCALLDGSENKKIVTLLGLSFKAHTSDIRNAPAIEIIKGLLKKGNLQIRAYDPQAIDSMKKLFPAVSYFTSPYDAIRGTDCIVVLTEWPEIKQMHLKTMAQLCNHKVLFDTKNIYSPQLAKKYNFKYLGMGNGSFMTEDRKN